MELFESSKETQSDEQAVAFDLLWVFSQAFFLLSQGYRQEVSDSPISFDAIHFLSVIKILGEDATPSEVARFMVRKRNSVSSMMQRLERKGFVKTKKLTKPNNRVSNRIEMTKRGEQLYNELIQKADFLFEILSVLTLEEKQQCLRSLFKVREAAAKRIKNYEEPPYPSP